MLGTPWSTLPIALEGLVIIYKVALSYALVMSPGLSILVTSLV